MVTSTYACGCTITCQMDGSRTPVGIRPCEEHGNFHIVQRAMRMLREAVSEAHEQLPPGPKEAA